MIYSILYSILFYSILSSLDESAYKKIKKSIWGKEWKPLVAHAVKSNKNRTTYILC